MDMTTHREAWQQVANTVSISRPSVGRRVVVTGSKKHNGKVGIVRWHGVDKYSDAFRYCDNAQATMREMMGTYGYCVKIVLDNGESFFVKADQCEVISHENVSKYFDMIIRAELKNDYCDNMLKALEAIITLI
jgi:hypothetical protein